MMPFPDLMAAERTDGDAVILPAPEDFGQGRGIYGGLIAVVGYRAMRHAIGPDRPMRSLLVTFVGPVPFGETRATATVLRQGKSVTLVEAKVWDGDRVAATMTGAFGNGRDSTVRVDPAPAPNDVIDRDALPEMPFIDGLMPNFMAHVEFRFGKGQPPFTGAKEGLFDIHVRLLRPSGDPEVDVLMISDANPTPALPMLKAPAPASSLTWQCEIVRPGYDWAGDSPWGRIRAEVNGARDGYVTQQAVLYGDDGLPVAYNRQTVTIFG